LAEMSGNATIRPSGIGLVNTSAFFVTNPLGNPKLKLDERLGLFATVDPASATRERKSNRILLRTFDWISGQTSVSRSFLPGFVVTGTLPRAGGWPEQPRLTNSYFYPI
jgi:hypothetical protein